MFHIMKWYVNLGLYRHKADERKGLYAWVQGQIFLLGFSTMYFCLTFLHHQIIGFSLLSFQGCCVSLSYSYQILPCWTVNRRDCKIDDNICLIQYQIKTLLTDNSGNTFSDRAILSSINTSVGEFASLCKLSYIYVRIYK